MDGLVELIIEKKMTSKEWMKRLGMIALCILGLFLVGILGIYILIFEFFIGFLTYLVFRNTRIEYEYSFIHGLMTFTVIYGQSKRKELISSDMAGIQVVAPVTSSEVSYIVSNPNANILDVTSGYENGSPAYLMVGKDENGNQFNIRFDGDSKLIEALKANSPRKVFL